MDVPGGDRADAQPLGELREQAVAAAIATAEGALQLDAQVVCAEGREQVLRCLRRLRVPILFDAPCEHAVAGAAGQADEALGVPRDGLERNAGLEPVLFVCLCQEPAEVAVAARVLTQERQVVAVGERDLGTGDRPDSERRERLRHLHRAMQAVVVGQRERLVALLGGRVGELDRVRCAVEEREGRMTVELDVRHTNICSHSYRQRA